MASSSLTTTSSIVEIMSSSFIYNHNQNQATESQWRYPLIWTIVLCIAYSIVFIMGLVGNSAVLWVINMMRHNTPNSNQMMASYNNVFNYFICNLALADLLVILFCLLPNLLGNILTTWILGRFVCKAVPFLQGVAVTASIYSLVAISIDRPLVRRYVVAFIWIFSLIISSPWLIFFDVHTIDDQLMCHEIWPEEWISNFYFIFVNFGLQYLLPVLITIFFYLLLYVKISRRQLPLIIDNSNGQTNTLNKDSSIDKMNSRIVEKSRLKVLKMLITIVSVFVLSWLPLYVIFCFLKFTQIDETSFAGLLIIGLTPLAQWLGAANSCINPILYFFFNPKFRSYLRKAITKSYLRYLNHRDSNYLTNCNVKNSYHWRSATVRNTLNLPPTPSSLNNPSNKPQSSPNIFNTLSLSSSSSSSSKTNEKTMDNYQNPNDIKIYSENNSVHKHAMLLLSQRLNTNYSNQTESSKTSESNTEFNPVIDLNFDVGCVPTATATKIMYPAMKMTNSLLSEIINGGIDDERTSSSSLTPLSPTTKTMTKNIFTQKSNNRSNRRKLHINRRTKKFHTNVQKNNINLINKNNYNGNRLTTIESTEFPIELNYSKKINCNHNNDKQYNNNYHNTIITLNNYPNNDKQVTNMIINNDDDDDDDDDDNSFLFHRHNLKIISNCFLKISTTSMNLETSV
ncbi:Neuropeptide FF receptor 2 [Dermatophagoides pteronyssinus]|uniref:Neuropeptide FF receptor 2 n=1 Tax=Dermatophagoides pteronyssinus TaxID=6956 RepID=A0ABQ8JAC7_DERPT|nr:Neuropeptide FF receptor 2 [Dermatophagoides pteronyssinus]